MCVQEMFVRVRRLGLLVAGTGSGILGLVVAWAMVQPGVIGGVETAGLVGIFGLLVLPTIVYAAWAVERRATTKARARERTRRALEAERLAHAAPTPPATLLPGPAISGIDAETNPLISSVSPHGHGIAAPSIAPSMLAHPQETRRAPLRRVPGRVGAVSET